jgi:RecA/RadA recombinase
MTGPKKVRMVKKKEPDARRAILEEVLAAINSKFGPGVIRYAQESDTSFLLRRPTGIPSLDIGLGGGFPAGALSVVVGPESAGKDYLLNRVIAMQQHLHGEHANIAILMTEFPYDKLFARKVCGVKVALTDQELQEYAEARDRAGNPMSKEERVDLQTQVGNILLIQGVVADQGFDILMPLISSNAMQVVGINSLGVLQTQAKEDVESFQDFAQQSNEAQLISKVMPKLFSELNKTPPIGSRNETCVLAINQVRAKRDVRIIPGRPLSERERVQPATQANALKHGKAIELFVYKGAVHLDKDTKPPTLLGREINWEITKGKLGTHDGIRGRYDFYFDGGADVVADTANTSLHYRLIKQAGAWYSYNEGDSSGFKVQGMEGLRRHLNTNPEVTNHLATECLRASGLVYRYV